MSDTGAKVGGESTDTSPLVATILSLLIPGLGLIVAGEPVKGRGVYWFGGAVIAGILLFGFTVITLGLGLILWVAWPLVHIGSAIDSYVQVDKIYQG